MIKPDYLSERSFTVLLELDCSQSLSFPWAVPEFVPLAAILKYAGRGAKSGESTKLLNTRSAPAPRAVLYSPPVTPDFTRRMFEDGVQTNEARGGVLGSIFAGYVPLASPNPYPIIVYSVANYRPHVSHFWANIPQIPICQNLLTPEIPQMCDPILVTLLAPNENATPL